MKTKWYDFGLELSLLLAVFLTPLVFAPQLNVSFELIKVPVFRSFVWIAFVFFAVKILYDRSISIPSLGRSRFLWFLIGAYFLTVLLSALLSPMPQMSFWGEYFRASGALTFLHYGLFFFLLIFAIRGPAQVKRFLYAALISGALVCANGLLQFFMPGYFEFWDIDKFMGRIFSTMGHPNYLATYLIMLIPLSFSLFLIEQSKKSLIFIGLFALFLVPLFLTLSRAAFVGLLIGAVLFLILFAKMKGKKWLIWTALTTPVLGILLLIFVNVFAASHVVSGNTLLSRLVLAGENIRSVETRLIMWPAVWDQILDKPILGYGPDTFSSVFSKYAPAELLQVEDLNSRADRAHNEILDILASFGFLGLIFYLGILISVFVIGIRKNNLLMTGLVSGILALFTANQFGFSLVTHYAYFWLFTALIIVSCFQERTVFNFNLPWISKALIVLLVLAFSIFTIFAHNVQLVRADYYFRKGLSDFYEKGAFVMLEDYKKACGLYPFQNYYSYAAANLALDLGSPENAEIYLEKGGKFSNYGDSYYFYLGRLRALTGGDFNKAFSKAASIAPTFPYIYLEWGAALYNSEDYEESASKLEKYLELVPEVWEWKSDLVSKTFEERERYRIFYKLNPDFNEVFLYLARDYFKLGNSGKAIYYLQFADENADSFSTYAVIYESLGEIEKAGEFSKRASAEAGN